MKNVIQIYLSTTTEQAERLASLQSVFAAACNTLAPIVRETRCWNRVGLHHIAYRLLRERFPGLGSQMACNAIYSVSRACRYIYQHPSSPFHQFVKQIGSPLPLLKFMPDAPVYFDRHTLSLKAQKLSLYTLDGRMHFQLALQPRQMDKFKNERLKEVVLSRTGNTQFQLSFHFAMDEGEVDNLQANPAEEFPEYLIVDAEVTLPVVSEPVLMD